MKKSTKKITAAFITCLAAGSMILAGCSGSQTTTTQAAATQAEETTIAAATTQAATTKADEATTTEVLLGGWTINPDSTVGYLPEDVQAAFDSVKDKIGDGEYVPVAYLGSQVVSGLNHMILCKRVKDGTPEGLDVVVLYTDTQGNTEVKSVKSLDLAKCSDEVSSEGTEAGLSGGWTVAEDYAVANIDANAEKAMQYVRDTYPQYEGAETLALLATQVVSGTNYAILCRTPDDSGNAQMQIFFIYESLDGTYELLNVYVLDLSSFNN